MIKATIKKINPKKSNKLIWAVAAGLLVVFTAFILLISLTRTPKSKRELMEGTLAYLKNGHGITEMKFFAEQNRVILVYDPNFEGDFQMIARFAALRLSYKIPDIELIMAKSSSTNPVYTVRYRQGEMAEEKTTLPTPPNDRRLP